MSITNHDKSLFQVKDLTAEYHSGDAIIHAVSGVSFDLKPGETLGLVGETGAGKTATARSSLRPLHLYTKALLSAIPATDIHRPKQGILLNGLTILNISPIIMARGAM